MVSKGDVFHIWGKGLLTCNGENTVFTINVNHFLNRFSYEFSTSRCLGFVQEGGSSVDVESLVTDLTGPKR